MTTAKKPNAHRLTEGADSRPLTRGQFPSTSLSGMASAYAAPSLLDCLCGERGHYAEAAELSREVVTVDLHCHPNKLGGSHLPELDPDVPSNMKAGGLDAGLFAARGDYPIIRGDASGRRYESRQPKPGELRSQDQLDSILAAISAGKLALAQSPVDILNAKKNGTPCAVLSIEGSDPLEGDVSRVKFFYDREVRVQLVHCRISLCGDGAKPLRPFSKKWITSTKSSAPTT